ncbi:hypothetical protein NE684_00485 [Pseudoflavonifractor phocaeensis]|nr:hypothetical protein [Pseudoflavonifractor phocaeensis]
MSRKRKQPDRELRSTRQLVGIEDISDVGIHTAAGLTACFLIDPINLSVQSEASIRARINALMYVFKGVANIEMMSMNGRESFEENKEFLKRRAAEESSPAIRALLEQDLIHFDQVQTQMATARRFLILVRLEDSVKEAEQLSFLNRVELTLREQGFLAHRATREELKMLLAVYFEANVTSDRMEDWDGQRWVI